MDDPRIHSTPPAVPTTASGMMRLPPVGTVADVGNLDVRDGYPQPPTGMDPRADGHAV